jgi:hypothetical protein
MIQYSYTPAEFQRGADGYPEVIAAGNLELWDVNVLRMERYDDDGNIVEEWTPGDASDARVRELNQLAYDKVLDELDAGWLAERLVREVT